MVNLLKMDMYRLLKSKSFKVVLIVVVLLNLLTGPVDKIINIIQQKIAQAGDEPVIWEKSFEMAKYFISPLGFFDGILILLSIVWFSYADLGQGYIKNIAGQLPQKGYSVISKFLVVGFQNFVLMFAAACSQTIGSLPFRKCDFTTGMGGAMGYFFLKWLLLLSISAIILFFSSGLRSKNAATTTAVLMGGRILSLTYMLFSMGIQRIPMKIFKDFQLSDYMPDSLMELTQPPIAKSVIISLCLIVVFMSFTVRIFNKKDVN